MRLRTKTTHVVIHRTEILSVDEYHAICDTNGHIHWGIPFVDVGAASLAANAYAVNIALFGNFASLERSLHGTPTEAQLDACADLIRDAEWWFGRRLEVVTHSSLGVSGTRFPEKLIDGHDCPGKRGDPMGRLFAKLGR